MTIWYYIYYYILKLLKSLRQIMIPPNSLIPYYLHVEVPPSP